MTATKTMTANIKLAKLAAFNPVTIAKLHGLKSIIRVATPRRRKWFLALPAIGDEDSSCILIRSEETRAEFKGGKYEATWISVTENEILAEYADRIVTA